MKKFYRGIVGFALLLCILVSSYMTIVQIVNALGPCRLLDSLSVKSLRRSGSTGEFFAGDTLEFKAVCGEVNTYDLRVYQNSSLVFEVRDRACGSLLKVYVPLVPPTFKAGGRYTAVLGVYVFNSPILGTFFTDSDTYTLEVSSIETRLKLDSEYNSDLRSLSLNANLTDVDGYPTANEIVDFCLQQPSARHRITDGWLPIGSAATDASGMARLSIALNVPTGNYSLRARHTANGNYGQSESIVSTEVLPGLTFEGLTSRLQMTSCLEKTTSCGCGESVLVDISSPVYAVLSTNATASFTSETPLGGTLREMVFYCDYTNYTGFLAFGDLTLVPQTSYTYLASLVWSPNITGSHRLIAGVVVGDQSDLWMAMTFGNNTVALGEVDPNITSCPTSVVLHFPEAAYGDVLPITVAFSRPWIGKTNNMDVFTGSSLGPRLDYNNISYVIDEPVESVPVRLYVNDSSQPGNYSTNTDGLVSIPYQLNLTDTHFTLNVSGVVDQPPLLYQGNQTTSLATFTRMSFHDAATGGSDILKLNCTLNEQNQTAGSIYVGAENSVQVSVGLYNLPVSNAPVSVLAGKPLGRDGTNSSGWVSAPSNSTLLRATRLYNATSANAACDVDRSGKIDMIDLWTVQKAYGSTPGSPKWSWLADVNLDLKVDMTDMWLVQRSYGCTITYRDIVDYSVVKVVFLMSNGWEESWLDRWGCASVPSGALAFNLSLPDTPIGAVAEFFKCASHQDCQTNSAGVAGVSWTPPETGSTNRSESDWPPYYFVLAWLPSSFRVFPPQIVNVTDVNATLSVVTFFGVQKRPIDLSVDYSPQEPTVDDNVTVIAHCFDAGLEAPAEGLCVDFYVKNMSQSFYLGRNVTDSSGIATLLWTPKEYASPYDDKSFWLRVVCPESNFTGAAEATAYTDVAYPTRLSLLGDEAVQVHVGQECPLNFTLVRADNNETVVLRFIDLYLNNSHLVYRGHTTANGTLSVSVTPTEGGLYFYTAQFAGVVWCPEKGDEELDWLYKPSNQVALVIVADVVPVHLLLDAQPREFQPGADVALTAQVLNACSGSPMRDFVVNFYKVDAGNSSSYIGRNNTDLNGTARLNWPYPAGSGPYAFLADVPGTRQLISSPLTLTVSAETTLSFDVTRATSGYNHTIRCRLLSYGQPVAGRTIKVSVNDSPKAQGTLNPDGTFTATLALQSVENKPTTYKVQATFEGDNPSSATAYSNTPNGTQYAVCTTIQYGYKPAANSTTLTVTPQSTDVMTATKTPEQMQQEAKDSGSLSVYNEWSWWYPWYRLHVKVQVADPVTIDVGFNPILPWGETCSWNGLEFFSSLRSEATQLVATEALGLIGTYLLAKYTSLGSFVVGIGIEALKIGSQFFFLGSSWNSAMAMLASALMSAVMLVFVVTDFGSTLTNFLTRLVDALKGFCGGPAVNVLTWVLAKIKDMFLWGIGALSKWVDGMEAVADAVTLIMAIARYNELIHTA